LNSHDPAEARVAILTSDIRKVDAPHGGSNPTRMRLVPPRKQTRNRKTRSVKRPRDKRYTHAGRM
jgi:hypothetical protein